MTLAEQIINKLSETFGAEAAQPGDYARLGYHATLRVVPVDIVRVGMTLKSVGLFLEYLTAIDRIQYLDLVYVYGSYGPACRIKVTTTTAKNASVPTLSAIFSAADWHEREVHDLFGQKFDGHPKLKPLLLQEDAKFHPLLKDFVSGESGFHDHFDLGEM